MRGRNSTRPYPYGGNCMYSSESVSIVGLKRSLSLCKNMVWFFIIPIFLLVALCNIFGLIYYPQICGKNMKDYYGLRAYRPSEHHYLASFLAHSNNQALTFINISPVLFCPIILPEVQSYFMPQNISSSTLIMALLPVWTNFQAKSLFWLNLCLTASSQTCTFFSAHSSQSN